MRRISLGIAAAGFLMQTVSAAGKPLEPTGKWVVDYRTDQCLASREYGTVEKPVTFGVRPAPNDETYLLLLAQKRPGPNLGTEREAVVDFGNGPIKSWLLDFRDKPSDPDIYQTKVNFHVLDAGVESFRWD